MADPITIEQLIKASQNSETLDDVVNGDENSNVTSPDGRIYPTIAKALYQVIQAGGYEPFQTEAALLASVPTVPKKAAIALDTFNVFLWENSSWKNKGNALNKTDALTINAGKKYPFRQMTRDNVNSIENTAWSNAILDVKVLNADPAKYYQIAYFQNDAVIDSVSRRNWVLLEFDKANFETASIATELLHYRNNQPQIIKDRKIQTIYLQSLAKPDIAFLITCDTSKFPANNFQINSYVAGTAGWSWIVDESCYIHKNSNTITKADFPRKFLYNRGDYFPFDRATFRGNTSIVGTTWPNVFQNIVVENAEDGYRYMLGYYTNGSTAFGENFKERWIVFKRSAADYAETTATEEQIVDINVEQDTLYRSGNIETIKLRSKGRELIHVTVDTSKLPAYGTYIAASTSGSPMWSWIITPSNYIYSRRSELSNYFEYDASTKSFLYRYKSGQYVYEWGFGPNGANNLPNFKYQKRATTQNVIAGNFATIQSFATDWLPPLVFYAENGDAGASTSQFTGGNHASNGDETGDPTAENELYEIFVDGIKVDKTKSLKCYADNVAVKIVNKIQASNTKVSKRFVLRQIFDLYFKSTKVDVHCQLKALEKLFIRSDYAVQMTTVGFQSTQLILSGKDAARIDFNANNNSGTRSLFPNAWAIILIGTHGKLTSWVDRTYGNCKPENAAPNYTLIKGGGGTNTKVYQCAFRSFGYEPAFPALELNVGADYKWRGGYAMQDSAAITNFDSVIDANNRIVSVIDANNYF